MNWMHISWSRWTFNLYLKLILRCTKLYKRCLNLSVISVCSSRFHWIWKIPILLTILTGKCSSILFFSTSQKLNGVQQKLTGISNLLETARPSQWTHLLLFKFTYMQYIYLPIIDTLGFLNLSGLTCLITGLWQGCRWMQPKYVINFLFSSQVANFFAPPVVFSHTTYWNVCVLWGK